MSEHEARPKRLRVDIHDLKPRTQPSIDSDLDRTLQRLGGSAGVPCERDCDCMIGLVCRDRVCTSDW